MLAWLHVRQWARKWYRRALYSSEERNESITKWLLYGGLSFMAVGFAVSVLLSGTVGTVMLFMAIALVFFSLAGIAISDVLYFRRKTYEEYRRREAVELAYECEGRMVARDADMWLDMPLPYERKVALINARIPAGQALTWKVHRMTMEDLAVASALYV